MAEGAINNLLARPRRWMWARRKFKIIEKLEIIYKEIKFMYLYRCRCNLIYGEAPEEKTFSNPHPHNFCPECDRAVRPWEVSAEYVPESVWINTPKHHYHPNYLD